MSHQRVARDRLRAAGSSSVQNRSTAADCLAEQQRPPTPPELGKFRKSFFKPGERTVHRGQMDDLKRQIAERAAKPASLQAFGSVAKPDGDAEGEHLHVHDVFSHGAQLGDDVAAIRQNYGESHYRMTNVPIGAPRPSNTVLPEHVRSRAYAFGVKAPSSEAAKNLLFPEDPGEDLHPEVYVKSHGTMLPGAQTKRNYDWSATGVDPNSHAFGKTETVAGESAAECISQKKRRTTRVVSKSQKDYMTAKVRYIGKPTSYGNHSSSQRDRTFGLPSDPKAKPGNWGAADCIRGDYGNDPDAKLGRSTKKGLRNVTTETRAFGCPTIRDDIAPPKHRSVSDSQNYGTDAHARALLFPSQFASIGVHDEDFARQRPPSTIRQIFANIGQSFTDDEFVRVWWRAATAGDVNGDGIVSVAEFKDAANQFDEAREKGGLPAWWQEAGQRGPAQLAGDVADSQRQ